MAGEDRQKTVERSAGRQRFFSEVIEIRFREVGKRSVHEKAEEMEGDGPLSIKALRVPSTRALVFKQAKRFDHF